jgi:hypothetical protein
MFAENDDGGRGEQDQESEVEAEVFGVGHWVEMILQWPATSNQQPGKKTDPRSGSEHGAETAWAARDPHRS